jgi:choline dehydrogenase-like flavoprotein
MPLSPVAGRVGAAARQHGLRPFALPLAINLRRDAGRPACVACGTCDTFACAISAKNDVATSVLAPLLEQGLEVRTATVVQRLLTHGDRVTGVRVLDLHSGRVEHLHARRVVLAAGALGSAHLVLASGLASRSPNPDAVGRFLTRHCSAVVHGVFPRRLEPAPRFHKQLGINDLYHGDPDAAVSGPLGTLQQMPTPPVALVEHHVRGPLGRALRRVVPHMTGLLAMAADQPDPANRVVVDRSRRDAFGMPPLVIEHRHTPRDLAARDHLVGVAQRVLRTAGALGTYVLPIETFSHAAGTLRMSADEAGAVIDPGGRFLGVEGLWVSDAAALPSTGAVNPSLTIAAHALRVGAAMAASTTGELSRAAA